jgi:hypothetical protein
MDLNLGGTVALVNGASRGIAASTVERVLPLHESQLLAYRRLSSCRNGLLINFNTLSLTNGIKRRVLWRVHAVSIVALCRNSPADQSSSAVRRISTSRLPTWFAGPTTPSFSICSISLAARL